MRPTLFTILLVAVVGATSAKAAPKPSLLETVPDDAHLVAFVRHLDTTLADIGELRANLNALGLGDEGFAWLATQSKAHLGIDLLDSKALALAGLDLARGAAFYRMGDTGLKPAFALAIGDERAFVGAVEDLLAKVDKRTWKKQKQKDGEATLYVFEPSGGSGSKRAVIAVRDGVAFVSSEEAAVAFVGAGAFSRTSLSSSFPDDGASLDAGLWIDFAGAAAVTSDSDMRSFGTMGVGKITARLQSYDDRLTMVAHADVQPWLGGFLGPLAPRFEDEARQTATLRALPPGAAVTRLLVPTSGILALLERNGALTPELRSQVKAELGFDIKDDLLDVFLGDLTFVSAHGLSDLRLEATVRDAGKAEKLVRGLLKQLDADLRVDVETRETGKAFVTTVRFSDRDAFITPRFFWGFQGGRMVVGLTEAAVTAAGATEPAAPHFNVLARERLLTPATFVSCGAVDDPLLAIHDIVAIVRGMLREDASPFTDLLDVPMLLLDRATDSALIADMDADSIDLSAELTMLPLAPGAPLTTAAGSYTAALHTIYRGEVERGLRAMAEVARSFPETPYGRKADRAVFASSGLMGLYALAVPGAVMSAMLARPSYDYEESVAVAAAAPVADPVDPCVAWARDVCYYEAHDSAACKKAEKILKTPDKKFSTKERSKCALDLYEMRGQ